MFEKLKFIIANWVYYTRFLSGTQVPKTWVPVPMALFPSNLYVLFSFLTLCLFRWKTFYKNSFLHFLIFDSTKKICQQKTLIKIKLIFNRFFSKTNFWKTISLSLITSPINIIFFCSCGKHIFLAPYLSHSKLSHFFSLLFAFSLIIYSLLWISSLIFFFSKKFSVWWILGKNYFFFFFWN